MFNTIDLFAGAGGLSYGFLMTGKFRLVAAAEINENARNTYKKNIVGDNSDFEFIKNVVGYDFTALKDRISGGIDVVIGGPPCQGFSNANRQKNNLISMNNSLVKEYFRAIKEIRPKAFVMENVSMLGSSTHRFYESTRDNEEITALIQDGYRIPKRSDSLLLSNERYQGITLSTIPTMDLAKILIPDNLYQYLSVLKKNMTNTKRLAPYLLKNYTEIEKCINECCDIKNLERLTLLPEIINRLVVIGKAITNCINSGFLKDITIEAVKNANDSTKVEFGNRVKEDFGIEGRNALDYIVGLQKLGKCISEIKENGLIGEYVYSEAKGLEFKVDSYSVIDYVNAILGNQYVQVGSTVNAEWFGVPQERRRYIVIGIRKDIYDIKGATIAMPIEPKGLKATTVKDAIYDLIPYVASTKLEKDEIPYSSDDSISEYAKEMRMGSSGLKNHITTNTTETALNRFRIIEQGKNFHSLDSAYKTTYSKPERTQNTIYLKLDPSKPCGTVVNVRKSMWIHPTLNRAITVREAARLQSFPDKYVFEGTKDSQYQQVGNAVPPLLAKRIAELLIPAIC